jgi:hypothetical protein
MPAAALPIIGAGVGAGGSIASGASGKKAQNKANQIAQSQLNLQQQQFGLTKQQTNLGNAAMAPASNFWQSLLSGNRNAATQATGPYAAMQGEAAQGARNAIQASTPRGGEQNLAIAQNYNDLSNNVARLYAGMQPLAAQNLQGLGSAYLGSGASFNPGANIGAAAQNYLTQQQNAQQAGSGFGSILYNAMNKMRQGGTPSLGGKQTPQTAGT